MNLVIREAADERKYSSVTEERQKAGAEHMNAGKLLDQCLVFCKMNTKPAVQYKD